MIDQEWFSVNQASALYGVHHRTVRRWIREGTLKAVKVGGTLRISREALEEAMK